MERDYNLRIHGVKPTTVGLFMGAWGIVLGLSVALLAFFRGTINYSAATDSLIQGLMVGLSAGLLTMLVLPVIYFAIGFVIGAVQAWVFNLVVAMSGGIDVASSEVPVAAPQRRPVRTEPSFGERIDRRRPPR